MIGLVVDAIIRIVDKEKRMKKSTSMKILFCVSLFLISGCGSVMNKNLSPPADTRWINVEVKNPSPYTRPLPLQVTYISYKCKRSYISAFDGAREEKNQYNGLEVPLEQQGNSDIWRAKLAMNGGGHCDWMLSHFSMKIKYIDTTHLGNNLVSGIEVGATIAVGGNIARNGQFEFVNGDLNLSPKYYPYIIEKHLSDVGNYLTMLGKEKHLDYYVANAKDISLTPTLDESKIVRYIGPVKKVEGVHAQIVYPDGSIVSDGTIFPDFNKVDKMVIK